eukprot:7990074-Ditylum_brightwellii.AAC.1
MGKRDADMAEGPSGSTPPEANLTLVDLTRDDLLSNMGNTTLSDHTQLIQENNTFISSVKKPKVDWVDEKKDTEITEGGAKEKEGTNHKKVAQMITQRNFLEKGIHPQRKYPLIPFHRPLIPPQRIT